MRVGRARRRELQGSQPLKLQSIGIGQASPIDNFNGIGKRLPVFEPNDNRPNRTTHYFSCTADRKTASRPVAGVPTVRRRRFLTIFIQIVRRRYLDRKKAFL
jgi:hypothetical protein